MSALSFMSIGESEHFRCRVYLGSRDNDANETERVRFIERLASEGVVDCPAYDPWVRVLQARGWLSDTPKLETNPSGEGKIGRWRLTELGRAAWEKMRERDGLRVMAGVSR